MARPDFSKVWGSTNAPFTAITDTDYKSGWVFRTGAPPRRVNFDYFQNLSDLRHEWLGEQMLLAVGHEWQDDVTYDAYAITRSPIDGQLYRSLAGGNLNNEPSVSGSDWALGVTAANSLPRGYFFGFNLANNSGAPTTTVDVGAGAARGSANTVDIELAGTLRGILQASGSWAAGDNQNKLDTGAKAINSWYHVFAIRKTSDGTGDILFSLSATAPTMPSGYAGFRRISAVRTDASGNIIQFLNFGRNLTFKTPILDVDIASAIVDAAYVLSVPTGIEVKAKVGMFCSGADASWSYRSPSANAIVPSHTDYRGGSLLVTTEVPDRLAVDTEIVTNSSAQIHFRTSLSSAFRVVTYGWTEL